MIQFAVNEQSSTKAVLQAIDKMHVALVEEEKDDVIERDTSQTMSKSVIDEIGDETSLKGNVNTHKRTKRTDLTVISSGVPGLSAHIPQKRTDEETGMQSELRNIIELDEKFYIEFAQYVTWSDMGDWCRSSCGNLKSRSTWWYLLTATTPDV